MTFVLDISFLDYTALFFKIICSAPEMSTKFLSCLLSLLSLSVQALQDHCDKESCNEMKCKDVRTIEKDVPSIVFKKARGRLGNQLNTYAMMLQLKRNYGFDAYILQETYDILSRMFTEETIELPVFEKTFCSPSKLAVQVIPVIISNVKNSYYS